jgi:hypothetical protein
LARLYGGDRASTDWRHLGRLAGFTNQKPQRRTPGGYPSWVKVVHTAAGLARRSAALLQAAAEQAAKPIDPPHSDTLAAVASMAHRAAETSLSTVQANKIYQTWMRRWQITQRFGQPDWSIVDLWVARALLAQGTSAARVQAILRLGSPQFPRGHSDPDDYLRRTLARAFPRFPAPGAPVCATHACASTTAALPTACSNSTGGR